MAGAHLRVDFSGAYGVHMARESYYLGVYVRVPYFPKPSYRLVYPSVGKPHVVFVGICRVLPAHTNVRTLMFAMP